MQIKLGVVVTGIILGVLTAGASGGILSGDSAALISGSVQFEGDARRFPGPVGCGGLLDERRCFFQGQGHRRVGNALSSLEGLIAADDEKT